MKIQKIEFFENGRYKIVTENQNEFFIRAEYLRVVQECELFEGAEFFDEREEDLLDCGFAFAAEKKALSYLERAEQCRANLERKLLKKNFSKEAIKAALDFLQKQNFLSDERFARSWLNGHKIAKPQGRSRLLAELAARGIERKTALVVLEEFFGENNEEELCALAAKKRIRQKMRGEKLLAALMRDGFSYKLARSTLSKENID